MNTLPISVLDHGYVKYVDHLGSDHSVSNAARASFAKETPTFSPADERLISFLVRNNHTSPMRHAFLSFEVKAPLFVCRQWYKYQVGSNHGEWTSSWNEQSKRYVTAEPEFYIPQSGKWRSAPENKKQGSGDPVEDKAVQDLLTLEMERAVEDGLRRYNLAVVADVAVEQARGFLPAYFMYTSWRWSASLQAVLHFLKERLADDAQQEIQDYAVVVARIVRELFPVTYEAMLEC